MHLFNAPMERRPGTPVMANVICREPKRRFLSFREWLYIIFHKNRIVVDHYNPTILQQKVKYNAHIPFAFLPHIKLRYSLPTIRFDGWFF